MGRIALLFALTVSMIVVGSSTTPRTALALTSSGLVYQDLQGLGESWAVTGCDGTCAANIVIPSSVDGKPVTSIGPWSFYGSGTIVTIEIPASVTSIGSYAFTATSLLTSFSAPASNHFKFLNGFLLTKDGTEVVAYPGGSSATSLVIPEGIRIIRESSIYETPINSISLPASLAVLATDAMRNQSSLESITVAAGNTTFRGIDGVLFYQSTLLRYPPLKSGAAYSIPETTTSIAPEAFRSAQFLTTLALPSSLSTLDDKSFDLIANLESITVAAGNTTFSGIDGVLYGANTLFKYPQKKSGTTYSVLPGTIEIGYAAFDSAELLTAVTLPDSLRVIKWDGFVRMTRLTSINLPLGLTTLGSFSLAVGGLTSVVIPHTVTNWNSQIFAYTAVYQSVYFEGDAPPASVFGDITSTAKIYRIVGTNGWPALGELYGGLQQVAWDPAITTPRAPTVSALGESVRVTANRGSGGLPASYLVTASPGGGTCTIATGETSCVVAGLTGGTPYTFTTKATKGATTTASSAASAAVNPLSSQVISFADPADREFSATPFTVAATSNSNLLITLTTTTPEVCTVSGFNVSMLTPGTCTLIASQAGNTTYAAATDVVHSLTISADQIPPAVVAPVVTTTTTVAPVATTSTTVAPVTTTPPITVAPAATKTPVVSVVGTSVAIAREPSVAVAAAVAIGVTKTKVMVALQVPKASKPGNQVTKYVIQLKPAKGAAITKTISVKPGGTVKPTLSGKTKTSYSMTVTAVTKAGKKTMWKGPQVKTS